MMLVRAQGSWHGCGEERWKSYPGSSWGSSLVGFTHGILFEVALEQVGGFCSDHPSERRNQRLRSLRVSPPPRCSVYEIC